MRRHGRRIAAFAGTTLLAVMLWSPAGLPGAAAYAADTGDGRSPAARARGHVAAVMGEAIAVLGRRDAAAQAEGLRALVEDHMDLKTIGRYALGPAWKSASAGQREEFLAAFQGHVVALIAAAAAGIQPALRMGTPMDDMFSVGRVRPSMYGMTVDSRLQTGKGRSIRIGWRLAQSRAGPFRIVDLTLDGASLALDQRTALAAMLTRAKMARVKNRAQAAIDGLAGQAGKGPATLASRTEGATAN